MNKFKKTSRSKIASTCIITLSATAVISSGFAAWAIIGGESKEVSGNISADTVTNNFHTITFDDSKKDDAVFFAGPAKDKQTLPEGKNAWLTVKGESTEDLNASFQFTVANVSENSAKPFDLFESITLIETTSGDEKTKYATYAAEDKKYLAALPSYSITETSSYETESAANSASAKIALVSVSYDDAKREQTFTLSIRFGWGEAFGSKNPFDHYNALGRASYATIANNALNELSQVHASFKLTITTK